MVKTKPQKGDLLIAEPAIIGDVSFNRSIVLLADHSNEGSIGFILNKPLEYTINELVPELEATFKVYNGGPVEQDNLYFIGEAIDVTGHLGGFNFQWAWASGAAASEFV